MNHIYDITIVARLDDTGNQIREHVGLISFDGALSPGVNVYLDLPTGFEFPYYSGRVVNAGVRTSRPEGSFPKAEVDIIDQVSRDGLAALVKRNVFSINPPKFVKP